MSRDEKVSQAASLLHRWLTERVSEEGRIWLEDKRKVIAGGAPARVFFTSFSAVPRYTGKQDLDLTASDLEEADRVREGWQPGHWSVDQAARTLLMLALPHEEADAYVGTLQKVFATADVGENVALYQSLPLLPHPERFRGQAAEGVRSNMTSVFDAVALHNPYPAEYSDDIAWNQMVLKAVFVGSPLHQIQGLDQRANAKLARMLVDYAHERWAAGRSVTPELWRPVGPYARDAMVDDLEQVLISSDPSEQEVAALALSASPAPRAQELLNDYPELQARIKEGTLTWSRFSQQKASRT